MIQEAGRWVTIAKAAEAWGVSRRTIYNWMYADTLETLKKPSGRVLVRVPAVLMDGSPALDMAQTTRKAS